MLHIMFGFEKIGQAVSEKKIFEYHGHIRNIYSPGPGANNTPEDILFLFFFFKNTVVFHSYTSSKFPPFNYILLIFPIQMHAQPMLVLP